VESLEVTVGDPSLKLDLCRFYTKTEATQTEAPKKEDQPPRKQNTGSDRHAVEMDVLTYKTRTINGLTVHNDGYSIHTAEFLDRPINNCVSMTFDVTVTGGSPKGFLLFVQDLDGWHRVSSFKAEGRQQMTETMTLSNLTSLNAFALVPTEGDYRSTFTYKLTGAEVYGSGLEAQWQGTNVVFTGENLTIEVKNDRQLTVTLSGLDLLEEYPSYLDAHQGTKEYQWNVTLTSGDKYISFRTDCPVPVPKFNQPKITQWREMEHTFVLGDLEYGELHNHVIRQAKPSVAHTADSIIWTFDLEKNHPFDFTTGITAEVSWFDRAHSKSAEQIYYGR
jgi:hypothetical protein